MYTSSGIFANAVELAEITARLNAEGTSYEIKS